MANSPEKYGLDLDSVSPLRYDTIQVEKGKQLRDIARKFGVKYQTLQELNPELKKYVTPPGKGTYMLKVPFGMGSVMLAQNTSQQEKKKGCLI